MDAKLTIPQEMIEAIASKVVEKLLPYLQLRPLDDEILSIVQVSKLLGKSKEQIYQWVSESKHGLCNFPYMKTGKSLRFSKNSIIKWAESNGKSFDVS